MGTESCHFPNTGINMAESYHLVHPFSGNRIGIVVEESEHSYIAELPNSMVQKHAFPP
jgi:hypothetical protein